MQTIILNKQGWKSVTGPIGATVMTLHEIGWKPISPGYWRNGNSSKEAVLSELPYEVTEIADAVAETAEEVQWVQASLHHLGKGLERGCPSLEPARRARKSLLKQEDWKRVAPWTRLFVVAQSTMEG